MTIEELTLARRGFRDGALAARRLAALGNPPDELVDAVVETAAPDVALASLEAIGRTRGLEWLLAELGDPTLRARLLAVLGASQALGEFVARHPEVIADLAGNLAKDWSQILGSADDADSLRVAHHRALLRIAARDLAEGASFRETAADLSDLAVATLAAGLRIVRAADAESDAVRLAVIALGKTGGHELNYISDVDVMFAHEPADGADGGVASAVANRLAAALIRLCGTHTAEGVIWEVDANLRPEGVHGPLSRTVASHAAYYEKWATTWEFQALLKARFAAGDAAVADRWFAVTRPMVWEASTRTNFVADTRAMRRRVIENIPAAHRERQLKLGSGGLRDVEFAVQMLQLVHGRADESLRSPTTLDALSTLIDRGYVGRADGASLHEAYEFLRTLEHRIQLFGLRRTHAVPDDPEELRRIARSMGLSSAKSLEKRWQRHRVEVMRLHEKLFYRPLLEAVAKLPTEGLRLSTGAAEQRLRALGFSDPRGALAHISALTSGVARRAAIQRSLLPAMLAWFAESPDPDGGLLAFRQVSESLGESHWYLRQMRDEGAGAEQLARVLGSSRFVADLIRRAPDSVAMFGDDDELQPRSADRVLSEMRSAASRQDEPLDAIRALRRVRRRELGRLAITDVLGGLDIDIVGQCLAGITAGTLTCALESASQAAARRHDGRLPTRMAIVMMGRLGGGESGYGSDADVMFVHDPLPGVDDQVAADAATAVASMLRTMLGAPGDDPALEVDADLRPEGPAGPLVRSLTAYRGYYARWSATWEAQALLRASASIGDPGLCADFTALVDPLRWPEAGLTDGEIREIRRIKARVENERLPRGANPNMHLKLGRGGIADVEWVAQFLQMRHAHEVPELRTTRTIDALQAAQHAGLITEAEASTLIEAWRLASRIRNAIVLATGRPGDSLPEGARQRAGVAHLLGHGVDGGERLTDDYLRITRRARAVVERVFY